MPSHPLHFSCARPTIINKERSKWLIKCKDNYRKFAPRIDDRTVEVNKDHAPWDTPSIIYCINHTLSKLTSTNKKLKSAAIQDMQKFPVGAHYYTDGSKSDSRAAAAFIVNKKASYLRLNEDATITQAEPILPYGAH